MLADLQLMMEDALADTKQRKYVRIEQHALALFL